MKTLLALSVMVIMVTGCQLWRNTSFGSGVTYSQYPECKNEPTQGDWMRCVKEIQEKEGKSR